MRSIKTILTTVLLGVFLTLGCDSVVDQNSPDTSEFQVQSTENYFSVGSFGLLEPFTQDELDDNWEADRFFPTGGVTSVTAFGRDNVAQISLNSTNTQPGTFQRTEGIKTVGVQDFGKSAQVDLYLDPDWEYQAVRNGFWLSGINDEGNRSEDFVIIEFVNLEPSDSGVSAKGDHTGWRAWSSGIGWFNLDTPFEYGIWYTLAMELDTNTQEYTYSINGEEVATQAAKAETKYIGELFLNSYNYGLDVFPNLENGDYAAHWHAGVSNPTTKKECMSGGWVDFGFQNQGQCIRFVNTGKDSR